MTRQGRSLVRDTLHQIAVAADRVSVVVDDSMPWAVVPRGQPRLGDRHPHPVREALSQRSGGNFHTRGESAFRMARSLAAPLTEALQFRERQVVAGEIEQAV